MRLRKHPSAGPRPATGVPDCGRRARPCMLRNWRCCKTEMPGCTPRQRTAAQLHVYGFGWAPQRNMVDGIDHSRAVQKHLQTHPIGQPCRPYVCRHVPPCKTCSPRSRTVQHANDEAQQEVDARDEHVGQQRRQRAHGGGVGGVCGCRTVGRRHRTIGHGGSWQRARRQPADCVQAFQGSAKMLA